MIDFKAELSEVRDGMKDVLAFLKKKGQKIANSFDEIDDWVVENVFRESIYQMLEWSQDGPKSMYFKLSALLGCQFVLQNTEERRKLLYEWYKKPPHDNKTVKQFIFDMQPDEITILGNTTFSLGLTFGIERGCVFDGKTFLKKFDLIFKRGKDATKSKKL